MTPYGRRTARLTAAREKETSYWLARGGPAGDPRATGSEAIARMSGKLGVNLATISPGALALAKRMFADMFAKRNVTE